MQWPRTFRSERVLLIQELSLLTGYSEPLLVRALRGIPVTDLAAFTYAVHRERLDQLVEEARAYD